MVNTRSLHGFRVTWVSHRIFREKFAEESLIAWEFSRPISLRNELGY